MNRASGKYNEFEQILLQYVNIVAPIIQSLWSLEAAHTNVSDVLFSGSHLQLLSTTCLPKD